MEVHFHTDVLDVTAHAAGLVKRALVSGLGLTVVGEPSTLQRLSEGLWGATPQAFLPHVLLAEGALPEPHLSHSLVWLMPAWLPSAPTARLLNMGEGAVPDGWPHPRVFEIVGLSPDARQRGRQRWQTYQQRGCTLLHHKIPS